MKPQLLLCMLNKSKFIPVFDAQPHQLQRELDDAIDDAQEKAANAVTVLKNRQTKTKPPGRQQNKRLKQQNTK